MSGVAVVRKETKTCFLSSIGDVIIHVVVCNANMQEMQQRMSSITKTKMTNGNQKTSHPKSDTHKFPVIFFTQIPQIILFSLKKLTKWINIFQILLRQYVLVYFRTSDPPDKYIYRNGSNACL